MKKFALVMLLMLGMCAVASSAFAVNTNVAPEPISATLFLLGGAGLAISRIFGKKNGK